MVQRSSMMLLLFLLATGAGAQNLYPDAGFEQTGKEGVAHSGQRAGYLDIGAKEHWRTIGGPLSVEPFATYHATAWAKATFKEGAALALYVYQWDSYVWAFAAQVPIANGGDWQEVEVTFCVPQDSVYLHPLAFLDASDGQAWVDDITLEKVKSPEETMAAIAAKPQLSADEARLLVRWQVQHGDFDGATTLLKGALDGSVKADIACVIANATDSPDLRARMLVAMIQNGALGLNAGTDRVREVADQLAPETGMEAFRDAVAKTKGDKAVVRGFAAYVESLLALRENRPALVNDRLERVRRTGRLVESVRDILPQDSEPYVEVDGILDRVHRAEAEVRGEMKQLGHVTIMLGGQPILAMTHAIVLPDEPTPSEDLAAHDLQAHLERITSQVIPISTAGEARGKSWLVVGKSPLVNALGVDVEYGKLGEEGLRIKTIGPHLVLTGNVRGVLYALYVFLEEHLGCRWFSPDCATWPTTGTIELGDLDITQMPVLEYRATDYPNSRPPEFAVRNRLNGTQINADAAWGGKISYRGFVHTFNSLVPPDQYFADHPQYFSEIGGQRLREYTQLCLTNPDVLRVATDTVRRWIAESPDARIISVSQNDWHNACQCAKCAALAAEEGSESGPLLHFVNAIAEAIAEDHPHLIIDTLAYQYTRKPPLHVKPHPNVAVRLCSIECEFNRPLETSPYNKSFVDDIRGWNAICDRLHIWDYVIDYPHCVQPFPNLNVLQPNIQFFIANGVTGIYEEANYFSKGGELAELRTYLMAKVLWQPDYDVQRAIDEFCAAYYGPAAPLIRAYLDDIHRLAVSDDNWHMTIWMPPRAPYQTPEAVGRYRELFDQAEAAVKDDPVRLHRVRVARLPIIYTQLAQAGSPLYELAGNALVPTGGSFTAALAERFEATAKAEGLTRVAEGGPLADVNAWLAHIASGPQQKPVLRLQAGGLEAVVVPSLGGRLLSLKLGDRELLQIDRREGGIDPSVGGYKEFSEAGYQSPGWTEPYEIKQQGAYYAVLAARLRNGLAFERRYELAGDKPLVRISTTLTNVTQGPVKACIRAHPCFSLADAAQARLRLGPAGADTRDLTEGLTKETELWLRDAAKPAGEWAILDLQPGIDLISRFKPEQVALCYFNWTGPGHRANPELWSAEVGLAAGDSLHLDHEYEVVAH